MSDTNPAAERRKPWMDIKTLITLVVMILGVGVAWASSQAEIKNLRERMDDLKPMPAAIAKLETSIAVLSTEIRYLREQRTTVLPRDPRRDVP